VQCFIHQSNVVEPTLTLCPRQNAHRAGSPTHTFRNLRRYCAKRAGDHAGRECSYRHRRSRKAVDLSADYNLSAIYSDGKPFTTGLDGEGDAYSSNVLTPHRILNGIQFNFGPANQPDAVAAKGQTIPLPAESFATLQLLATGFNGNSPHKRSR